MSNAQPVQSADDAELLMMQRVTLPSFFAKLATDGNYTPPDDAASRQMLGLSDMVKRAVYDYMAKVERYTQSSTHDAVKFAADVAFELAEVSAPRPTPAYATSFGADDAIKAAADLLVRSNLQKAGLFGMGESDEEAEKKKKEEEEAAMAAAASGAPPAAMG